MRNMMVTVRDEDYVLLAEAAGLPRRRVVWYAVRNAILPQVSSFAMALSFVVAGSVLTEIVFSYPGIGFILLSAVKSLDYTLVQGSSWSSPWWYSRPTSSPISSTSPSTPAPDRRHEQMVSIDTVQDGLSGHRDARTGGRPPTTTVPALQIGQDDHRAGAAGHLRVVGRPRADRGTVRPDRPRPLTGPPQPGSTSASQLPGHSHLLGQTNIGGDVFSQLLAGTRPTMIVAFLAGLLATVLAVIVGITAGYVGGLLDDILSLIANVFLVIPALPLLIAIGAFLGPNRTGNPVVVSLIIALTGGPGEPG